VQITPNPGINVIFPSVDTPRERALGIEDGNETGSASNCGNPVGHVLPEETESNKGVNLLETLSHTPPQSKPPSPFSCHRGWAMG